MAASLKTLRDAFEGCLDKNRIGTTEETLQALRYALQTGDRGRNVERVLAECNTLLEGFGVECIAQDGNTSPQYTDGSDILAEYVNMGDTYACTVLYNYRTQTYQITSWGDFVERNWKDCGGDNER
jgi:hypothetical protein